MSAKLLLLFLQSAQFSPASRISNCSISACLPGTLSAKNHTSPPLCAWLIPALRAPALWGLPNSRNTPFPSHCSRLPILFLQAQSTSHSDNMCSVVEGLFPVLDENPTRKDSVLSNHLVQFPCNICLTHDTTLGEHFNKNYPPKYYRVLCRGCYSSLPGHLFSLLFCLRNSAHTEDSGGPMPFPSHLLLFVPCVSATQQSSFKSSQALWSIFLTPNTWCLVSALNPKVFCK